MKVRGGRGINSKYFRQRQKRKGSPLKNRLIMPKKGNMLPIYTFRTNNIVAGVSATACTIDFKSSPLGFSRKSVMRPFLSAFINPKSEARLHTDEIKMGTC